MTTVKKPALEQHRYKLYVAIFNVGKGDGQTRFVKTTLMKHLRAGVSDLHKRNLTYTGWLQAEGQEPRIEVLLTEGEAENIFERNHAETQSLGWPMGSVDVYADGPFVDLLEQSQPK